MRRLGVGDEKLQEWPHERDLGDGADAQVHIASHRHKGVLRLLVQQRANHQLQKAIVDELDDALGDHRVGHTHDLVCCWNGRGVGEMEW